MRRDERFSDFSHYITSSNLSAQAIASACARGQFILATAQRTMTREYEQQSLRIFRACLTSFVVPIILLASRAESVAIIVLVYIANVILLYNAAY